MKRSVILDLKLSYYSVILHTFRFNARNGSFDLNFQRNCTVMIAAPEAGSRIMLTCSPILLGDCKTHKDSLTLNLIGDLNFEKNSYFYCGRESSIRAVSVRNKLAVRVKKTDEILGSTQCTFHTRKLREFNPSDANSCGRLGRNSKIVGGRRVPPGLFPWVSQLDITRTDGSKTGCTGSIVSPHYILTAAHCMKRAESISAFMGGTDRQEILGSEVLIQAEKYILHKKWSSKTLLADIALLKLTEPVQYTDDISPICLPEGKLLTEDFAGRRAVAVGWGRTDSKKKAPRKLYRVKLPFLSDSSCRQIYRRFYIPKVMMCTDSKTDSAICYGMT
ncbi:unnamed protein product [Orchesella dallaii]|uniref:Peptidase S1 domain-containing protein n=1 Tax=Orchesella dallaii TaxID=48710 RepID=A0ABP1PUE6_9HEXA